MHPIHRIRCRLYSAEVTITNPLVLYRALLATNKLRPDPAQLRLALHLQKLYERLKDYEPTVDYSDRLNQLTRTITNPKPSSYIPSSFLPSASPSTTALIRVLTNHESAITMDSPKGLLLHGEVGTGKSMLIDLFADSLPNRKKRRWHYNTFILDTFAQLEHLRKSRLSSKQYQGDTHALLVLARDLIEKSPILFLDEFQLPDRAASKILSNLFISFFHLGGVLVATSNRMPEELQKASGVEFGKGELAPFVDVLKARCEIFEMQGGRDYRRMEAEVENKSSLTASATSSASSDGSLPLGRTSFDPVSADEVNADDGSTWEGTGTSTTTTDTVPPSPTLPSHYLIRPSPTSDPTLQNSYTKTLHTLLLRATSLPSTTEQIPWKPSTLKVYGRTLTIPQTHNHTTLWTFAALCETHNLGPADYISLASHYNTLILTGVPVLTHLQKNEARRFITLLDALYEARCKLIITADAGPDEIFFPETKGQSVGKGGEEGGGVEGDVMHSETFAEAWQDVVGGFRPNISTYDAGTGREERSRLKDGGEIYAADTLEDDAPWALRHGDKACGSDGSLSASTSSTSSHTEPSERLYPGRKTSLPNFGHTSAFTGEDERFAYKRARSRIWEMCSERWWARSEEGWWRPVESSVRRWEGSGDGSIEVGKQRNVKPVGDGEDHSATEKTEDGEQVKYSPFRTHPEPPPKISWTHIWGMMKWGQGAGPWGQGVEGLGLRDKDTHKDQARGKQEK
ncbi:hypothetical protein HDV00_002955 [Rhizophlyctis rosea]|nr:hypothetical protein HDV00_002955 [Rhizophlyctis rosea]